MWELLEEEPRLSIEIPAGESPLYYQKCRALCAKLFERTGGRVFGGPFAGMRVPQLGAFEYTPAFLVGSYEAELHAALLEGIVRGFNQIINIGSAEGYYAVGLARAISSATVVAFDSLVECWDVCRETARLNDVSARIEQRGYCTPEELASSMRGEALVLCDCEGGERELLDPRLVPALVSSTIICELHDFYDQSITPTLLSRFNRTHSIHILHQHGRSPQDFPILDTLSKREKWLAVHENRHVQGVQFLGRYMVLTPKPGQERL